jgi:hypothetical protein
MKIIRLYFTVRSIATNRLRRGEKPLVFGIIAEVARVHFEVVWHQSSSLSSRAASSSALVLYLGKGLAPSSTRGGHSGPGRSKPAAIKAARYAAESTGKSCRRENQNASNYGK